MNNVLRLVYWMLAFIFGITGVIALVSDFRNSSVLVTALPELLLAFGFGYAALKKEKKLGIAQGVGASYPTNGVANLNGFICNQCGTSYSPSEVTEVGGRSTSIFILLLFFAIVPGLLYWALKSPKKQRVCNGCGAKDSLVPLQSPMGKNYSMNGMVPKLRNSCVNYQLAIYLLPIWDEKYGN